MRELFLLLFIYSSISTPFYTLASEISVQSTSTRQSSLDVAIMPEKMVHYLGYDERGNRQYCCTQYGVQVVFLDTVYIEKILQFIGTFGHK